MKHFGDYVDVIHAYHEVMQAHRDEDEVPYAADAMIIYLDTNSHVIPFHALDISSGALH